MRIPESLVSLVEHGVVDEVVRSLKSGKEADVYLVASEGQWRVAKVYKDAQSRSFKNRAAYTEGRQVRSSRDQRAMDKGSRYGRAQNEEAWQSAEVDMIYRLDAAGVRVPKPHHFIDGVLLMELVASPEGDPAPRLGEVQFSPEDARLVFDKLLADVVRMLVAGVVHGDLSEFNVLVAAEGPVIIDFPQAVNAARNQNARRMLMRDVENLQRFLQRHLPQTPMLRYAEEMWQLYERGELTAETQLTGKFIDDGKRANTFEVLDLIEGARRDERFKRQAAGRPLRGLEPARPGAPANGAPHPARPGAPHSHRAPAPQSPRPNPRPAPHHNSARPPHAPPPRPTAGHGTGSHHQAVSLSTGHTSPMASGGSPAHPGAHAGTAPPAQHPRPPRGPQGRPHPQQDQRRGAHPQRPPHAQHPQRPPHAPGGPRPPEGNRPPQPGGPRPGAHPPRGAPRPRGGPNPIVETKPQPLGQSSAPAPGHPPPGDQPRK